MSGRSWFRKSWGAEPTGEGRWRFRLWAPGQAAVSLWLDGASRLLERDGEGWFAGEFAAAPGAPYAFVVKDEVVVPDPAAREQVGDVHGASRLVDPEDYEWQTAWQGRPWQETVLYELHVGTFSPEGTFDGVCRKLDHLAASGITAIELCPVAQFSGERGWGYDGVLLYAPHRVYGGVAGLKRLVDAAHARELMVFLDVVYNHFGPDGNYLHAYAPEFFDAERHTPWGAAIAFEKAPVRRYFIENALYWLEEYRLDGLRLDAIDQIVDPALLDELASTVRAHGFGRPVHLTTEDERNITRLHRRSPTGKPLLYDGEWNDDFHHVAHVLATGESDGYYADYADDPRGKLGVALAQGFVQQGGLSAFRGQPRGEPSAELPPVAFVNFLQNHDQTGNRAFGERLTELAPPEAVEVLTAVLLLSPMVPLLFMGEDWGERRPFQFFCDFHGALADAVREGRRREFGRWRQFADPALRERIPDPNDTATFERSKLDWEASESEAGRARRGLVRELLSIRAREIVPQLPGLRRTEGRITELGERGLQVDWTLADGRALALLANLGGPPFAGALHGRRLFALGDCARDAWAMAVAVES